MTAFTIGHSITLSLAALDIVSPPARIIEPLIALSIVVVGADNLLVRGNEGRGARADIRAWLAAGVRPHPRLRLRQRAARIRPAAAALGWSLFSFNLGVEMGQLLIVAVVATALAAVRRRERGRGARGSPSPGRSAVILAGLYWFVERVFLPGGA